MSFGEQMMLILLCGLVTVLTRAVPFLVFREGQQIPERIRYLGNVLPSAIFVMLVVYCLRDVDVTGGTFGIPEFVSILLIAAVHIRYRKMLFSILCGMICYFVLLFLIPLVI